MLRYYNLVFKHKSNEAAPQTRSSYLANDHKASQRNNKNMLNIYIFLSLSHFSSRFVYNVKRLLNELRYEYFCIYLLRQK